MTQNKGYKIGAVSKTTGIPPETLRIWEHRYGIVRPTRGHSGAREYNEQDIKHLSLIKQLLANGDSIGNLANLSIEELRTRLEEYSSFHTSNDNSSNIKSVCVLGPTLPNLLEAYKDIKGTIEFTGLYTNHADFQLQVQQTSPDLLIIEYSNILEADIKLIRDNFRLSNARHLLIVYRFSNTTVIEKLIKDGALLVLGPVDYSEILRLCNIPETLKSENTSSNLIYQKTRRYSDLQLSKISMLQTSVNCECPHHIAQILTNLIAFENYSKNCEDQSKEDAALHAELYEITASARTAFEGALEKILISENIDAKTL